MDVVLAFFYPVVWLLLLVVFCDVVCIPAYIISTSILGFCFVVYMYCTVLADCPMLYVLFIKCIAYMYRIR